MELRGQHHCFPQQPPKVSVCQVPCELVIQAPGIGRRPGKEGVGRTQRRREGGKWPWQLLLERGDREVAHGSLRHWETHFVVSGRKLFHYLKGVLNSYLPVLAQ